MNREYKIQLILERIQGIYDFPQSTIDILYGFLK